MRQTVVAIVVEHPEFTLEQINDELRRDHGQRPAIRRTTLVSVLSGHLIVFKKLEVAPSDRNSAQVKDLGSSERESNTAVLIDEAGLNLWCRRRLCSPWPEGRQSCQFSSWPKLCDDIAS